MATRIKAAGGRIDLPKFRYLDDVVRYVDQLDDELAVLKNLSDKQSKLLAYLKNPRPEVKAFLVKAAPDFSMDIDTGTMPGNKSQMKRKIDPSNMKVVIPNLARLKDRYALIEDFYEKFRALQSVENTLVMQFRNRSEGPAYNAALQSVRTLLEKTKANMKQIFAELNEIAAGHVPKTFVDYMHALEKAVQERVKFEKSQLFLYVHVSDEGEIVFTYYMMLEHAVNDEGKITPHLYVSVQWVVDGSEDVFISVNHEYELPNKLIKDPGQKVTRVAEASYAIGHLLELEDFSTTLGTMPIGPQLKGDPEGRLFSYKEFTKRIKVEGDTLTFVMKPSVSNKDMRDMAYQLYTEVKHMLRVPKGAKIKMDISPPFISFNLASVAAPGQVNVYQAEWIKEQFGLNDTQLRKIVSIINQAKERREG